MATFFRKLFKKYDLQVREKNPVKTKMITCGLLFAVGDITCQGIEHYMRPKREVPFKYNIRRTLI